MEQRKQTIIDGETAIKPYYYLRNGFLHVRYTVDRAVELSESEVWHIKNELEKKPYAKQGVFADNWNFLTKMICKPIIPDGIKNFGDRLKEHAKNNGLQN